MVGLLQDEPSSISEAQVTEQKIGIVGIDSM